MQPSHHFRRDQLLRVMIWDAWPHFRFWEFCFVLAYPGRIVAVCLIVLGSAALLEYLQTFTPEPPRHRSRRSREDRRWCAWRLRRESSSLFLAAKSLRLPSIPTIDHSKIVTEVGCLYLLAHGSHPSLPSWPSIRCESIDFDAITLGDKPRDLGWD
jgi:hypothetical protein